MINFDTASGIYVRTIKLGKEYLGTKRALMEAWLVGQEPLPGQRGARQKHSITFTTNDGIRMTIRRDSRMRWVVAVQRLPAKFRS